MTEQHMPRWVKVAGIITAVAVLLFVILMLMGGHGPGRHMGASGEATAVATNPLAA
ncbi:hypothetical protein [Nonomuraea sp. NPDC049400]|uniref:hypothetical protein n=1 Tax=Nonomuraea sp. NPDC049400 TaxID=3364352 RepID=UPI0037984918